MYIYIFIYLIYIFYKTRTSLYMLQQNLYNENDRYLRWIKRNTERVYNFIDELKSKDYDKVLIVTHSGVSKAFNAYFNGINDGMFLKRGLKNCEIIEYEL